MGTAMRLPTRFNQTVKAYRVDIDKFFVYCRQRYNKVRADLNEIQCLCVVGSQF